MDKTSQDNSSAVGVEISEGQCRMTLDNPPVNVIGHQVRQGLDAAVRAAEDARADKVIVTGAGKAFAAGADAKEFDQPARPPHLPGVLARLEQLPAIAALNGMALGGGLEIALACRIRIAAPGCRLGLPEVTLGVVPGAGGTQRLPRLIGIEAAAKLISEGARITAEEALDLGLIDAIADDPVEAAKSVSLDTLQARQPALDRPAPAPNPNAIKAARDKAHKRARGQIAPQAALDLIEATAHTPPAQGLENERAQFLDLRQGPQAKALRHVFFAERAAAARSNGFEAAPKSLSSAVVVGGGTMGAGIAYALDSIGVTTTLVEVDTAAAERARTNIDKLFDEGVKRGKSTPEEAKAGKSRIAVRTGYKALPPVDIAIEAVFEEIQVKRAVFAALDAALPCETILATNTSYLDVNRIFEGIRAPERCLGLHFFSPAHVMKLVEIIRTNNTSQTTLASAFALAARLRKVPVEAGVCDGFIGNRILTAYRQVCDIMLLDGAMPWQVDSAMVAFGMAMGPYAVQDLSGLDIAYANRQRKTLRDTQDARHVPIADRMVEDLGRLGRKTGAGWYDYTDDGARPSTQVAELVETASKEAGCQRRAFTDDEIVARATTAMICESLHILHEGIARRPADIDLVLVHGYGFPRWRGGIMHHADRIGFEEVRDRVRRYAQDDPLSWRLPPDLEQRVAQGQALADLNQEKTE
ncbi:3-hydroxyacyl-CoA dehydrogenase NAD-binding domain-containing protein [Roseovarius sp. MMSF_3281]|uniref:3-hydroxyacyl-CoA dehydrogenase NAD-binding domain-containing protein n=1 Tax=Roseovarius sp. MMSF_3281 TaxID=3046694 RepID=UPI00273F2D5B|nr:3-hydroxyacyl-CoA dehydrogenase NAD-binding domain-containing protein [Roseovarius sp. MMSF_3281]